MRRTETGGAFIMLNWRADERTETPEGMKEINELRRTMSDAWWRKEMEGEADALLGTKVFPEWDSSIHVIRDDAIPKRGCLFMGIDPHPRTPHAALWVLIDQWSDWYVYREVWPSIVYGRDRKVREEEEDTIADVKDYAEIYAYFEGNEIGIHAPATDREYGSYIELHGGERIVQRLMDPAGKAFQASGDAATRESYAAKFRRYGIVCTNPVKKVEAGYEEIRKLLKPARQVNPEFLEMRGLRRDLPWPRLHVAQSCIEMELEFDKLRYMPSSISAEKELNQQASTYRRHLLDILRYITMSPTTRLSPESYRRYESARYTVN